MSSNSLVKGGSNLGGFAGNFEFEDKCWDKMPQIRVGVCAAVTQTFLQTLNENGIRTVADFIVSDIEDVAARCSLPYKDLLCVRRVLLAQYSAFPVTGADVYSHLLSAASILSAGCKRVDLLLDGGLYTGEVTELAGDIAAGKTQFCFTAAAVVAMETKQSVLYIDTAGSFSAERVVEILEERGCQSVPEALKCIRCVQAMDIYQVLSLLEDTKTHLARKDCFYASLRLVIVDSVSAVLSPVVGGQQSDGHALMCHLGLKLRMISSEYSCAVMVTNSLLGGESSSATVALGRTWHHSPHTRLILHHSHHTASLKRRAVLVKSSRSVVGGEASFKLTAKGIEDHVT